MRIFRIRDEKELRALMQEIHVDPYGIDLMVPKGITHLIRIQGISNIAANILKQELLSLGADAAIARGALTGATKKTDCLLMANLAQCAQLTEKLKIQPFGLKALGERIKTQLENVQKNEFIIRAGNYVLTLGTRTHIMGIVNLTPDSFSMDGWYADKRSLDRAALTEKVQAMVEDGADIIDIGGESSRPRSRRISVEEEITRTIPAIKHLAKHIRAPISIDTSKPEVARYALDNGASIVNDICGLRDTRMRKLVARYNAVVVLMHMKGTPLTMQKNTSYTSLIDEINEYLEQAIARACDAGVQREKIIIDPGIGFGKTGSQNLGLLKNSADFKVLGRPLLVGPSRKTFIGEVLKGASVTDRLYGTVAASVMAAHHGAHIIRVHDVKAIRDAVTVADAIRNAPR